MAGRPRLLFTGMTGNPGGKEAFILSAFTALRNDFDCWFLADRPHLAHEDAIEGMGGRIVHVRPRSRSPLGHLRDLGRLFDEISFEVVWSHQTVLNTIAPLGFARRAHVPVRAVHSHSTQNMGTWVAGVLHPLNKRLVRFVANRRFACSEGAARWFYSDVSWELIPNIFDVETFTFTPAVRATLRHKLGLAADTTVLIHTARFGVEKNHDLDVEILAEFAARGHDAVLLLVGDGERRAHIEQRLRERGVSERARLLGIRTDVPELLQAADLLILPSRFEGLSYSVLEAQAAGLPCLVSDRVPAEIRAGGEVRFLSLNAPTSAWADAVEEMLRSSRRIPGANPLRSGQYDAASSRERLISALQGSQVGW